MNKKNLYFISFDNQKNVYGGYVNELINKTHAYITDPNSFVFSLIRNGKVKNRKYDIKKDKQQYAFRLNSNSLYGIGRGHDICIYSIGESYSMCNKSSFNYCGEKHPFVDKDHPTRFAIKRILVIEMS